MARTLAELGYFVFALDVYGKGVRGDELGDNTPLMAPLMEDRQLLRKRLRLALETARADPRADSESIAIVGHCFGGLCALDLARSAPPG